MNNQKVYERILEIGHENPGEDFVFNNLIKELIEEFPDADLENDKYLPYWFSYHFIGPWSSAAKALLGYSYDSSIDSNSIRFTPLKTKAYFSANAYYAYIEKVELSEARNASLKAQNSSKTAIIISIIALGITFMISLIQLIVQLLPIPQIWDSIFNGAF